MKKVGIVLTIILIVGLSWVLGISAFSGKEKKKQLEQAAWDIKQGKEQEKLGSYGSVIDYYADAISNNPTVENYFLLADFYKKRNKSELYEETLKKIISTFPTNPKAYERLATYYVDIQAYQDCINIINNAKKAGVSTEKLNSLYASNRYRYHIIGGNYSECNDFIYGYSQITYKEHQYLINTGLDILNKEATYKSITPFFSDMTGVTTDQGDTYFIKSNNEKYLCSNKKYSYLGGLSEGLAVAIRDNKYYYVNGVFSEVLGPYDYASTMKNGVAAIKKGKKFYLINGSGKVIGKESYDDVKVNDYGICCNQDVIFVKKKDKYYMVDKEGKQVGENTYEDACVFEGYNVTAVKNDGKWGFVFNSGKEFMKPTYDEAKPFNQGLAPVKKDFYWGYIDVNKKMVIKPSFDDAKCFADNMAPILKDGYWKYIKLDVSE